ncbi:MAG: DNA mismatch endonuclease Vsr [Acidimicrobiia bacterium]
MRNSKSARNEISVESVSAIDGSSVSAHRSWNMSRIRSRDTLPERKLRSLLHRAGLRFRVNNTTLPGKPDIVLSRHGLVVFVHGCFWHQHQDCDLAKLPKTRTEFWREKFEKTRSRDQRAVFELESLGWRVIVIWECEIERTEELALRRVLEVVTARKAP